MRTLILNHSEWCRGHKSYLQEYSDSSLLRADGTMCCLGIDAQSRGIPKDELYEVPFPRFVCGNTPEIIKYREDWADRLSLEDSAEGRVGEINDNKSYSDEERIELLRPYFEARGINLVFNPSG